MLYDNTLHAESLTFYYPLKGQFIFTYTHIVHTLNLFQVHQLKGQYSRQPKADVGLNDVTTWCYVIMLCCNKFHPWFNVNFLCFKHIVIYMQFFTMTFSLLLIVANRATGNIFSFQLPTVV